MQILTITDLDEQKMHSLALTKCVYIYIYIYIYIHILLHLFMFSLSLIGILKPSSTELGKQKCMFLSILFAEAI